MRHYATYFFLIGETVAEIWRFLDFSKWRLCAILDLLCTRLHHPRRVFGGVYHCVKFGWNRYSTFNKMQVLIFNEFGFKMPIHDQDGSFFGRGWRFNILNGTQSHCFYISMAFGTLAIRWHPRKILRRSSQGNLSVGGVKHDGVAKYSDLGPIEGYISETVQ